MDSETNKKGFFKRNTWFKWLLILSVVAAIVYYSVYFFPEDFSKSSIFTQYKELKDTLLISPLDSVGGQFDSIDTANDTLIVSDSLAIITATDSLYNEYALTDSTNVHEPIIDESYKFGADGAKVGGQSETADANSKGNSSKLASNADMFNELLFAATPSDASLPIDQRFLANKLITSETVLKILATVGKDVLLNGNTDASKEIFASIVREEEIIGILVVDRKGQVVYSSDSKFIRGNIKNIFPKITLTSPVIGQRIANNQLLSCLAIYHTYGQIGNIILITK